MQWLVNRKKINKWKQWSCFSFKAEDEGGAGCCQSWRLSVDFSFSNHCLFFFPLSPVLSLSVNTSCNVNEKSDSFYQRPAAHSTLQISSLAAWQLRVSFTCSCVFGRLFASPFEAQSFIRVCVCVLADSSAPLAPVVCATLLSCS